MNSKEECKKEAEKRMDPEDFWYLGGHVVWEAVTCGDMSDYCKHGCVLSSCPWICVLSLDVSVYVRLGTDMDGAQASL